MLLFGISYHLNFLLITTVNTPSYEQFDSVRQNKKDPFNILYYYFLLFSFFLIRRRKKISYSKKVRQCPLPSWFNAYQTRTPDIHWSLISFFPLRRRKKCSSGNVLRTRLRLRWTPCENRTTTTVAVHILCTGVVFVPLDFIAYLVSVHGVQQNKWRLWDACTVVHRWYRKAELSLSNMHICVTEHFNACASLFLAIRIFV